MIVLATPNITADNSWYMDSGATHHITHDLTSLNNTNPFSGADKVLVSNGKTLDISNTTQFIIPSKIYPITLNKVLNVPQISTNLFKVNKLCYDNNAFVKFYANSFFVKDL